jgi:hypothetical protein
MTPCCLATNGRHLESGLVTRQSRKKWAQNIILRAAAASLLNREWVGGSSTVVPYFRYSRQQLSKGATDFNERIYIERMLPSRDEDKYGATNTLKAVFH